MFKVFVADNLSSAAVDFLKEQKDVDVTVETGLTEDALAEKIPEYDALLVRSATKATRKIIEAGKKLKLIGRAGSGTDNIDKVAASEKGILVINAPFGNLTSVAELVYGHIISALRYLGECDRTTKEGKWEKKRLTKTAREMDGKTLGIIGLGKIGQLVAQRAHGFNLKVLAYDPVTTATVAESVGAELVDLETLLKNSDFITLHIPLIPQTKHLLSEKQFALMKPTAFVLNCARGGVIDEKALIHTLKAGKLLGVALDCFEKEPVAAEYELLHFPNVFVSPHIGGDTIEAQAKVGLELVDQIVRALRGELVEHIVNLPFKTGGGLPDQKAWNDLAEKLAKLGAELLGRVSLKKAELIVSGEIAETDSKLIQISVLKGLLETLVGEANVNVINAQELAEKKGLKLAVKTNKDSGHFRNQLALKLEAGKEVVEIRGTVVEGTPRITFIQEFQIEFTPGKKILLTRHKDKPGVIGKVGTLLGQNAINIASMDLGRNKVSGDALMVLELDNAPTEAILKELEALEGFEKVLMAEL